METLLDEIIFQCDYVKKEQDGLLFTNKTKNITHNEKFDKK